MARATGLMMFAKLVAFTEKADTDKNGRPIVKRNYVVLFSPGDGQTLKKWISIPLEIKDPPRLDEGETYGFPVTESAGDDRSIFYRLSAHMDIQPAPELG